MAENKRSFILYADQIGVFEKLPDDVAGKLIKIIFDFVNDRNPEPEDILLQVCFEPIKLQLKRELKTWEAQRSKRSEAGKTGGIKSGESRRLRSKRSGASKNEANEADNVNVTVNVNGNVTEESNTPDLSNSNLFRQPTIPEWEDVHRVFLNHGGTKEMATAFFEKNNSVSWFLKGSPITNFANLVPSFVKNWKEIKDKNGKSITDKGADRLNAMRDYINR